MFGFVREYIISTMMKVDSASPSDYDHMARLLLAVVQPYNVNRVCRLAQTRLAQCVAHVRSARVRQAVRGVTITYPSWCFCRREQGRG